MEPLIIIVLAFSAISVSGAEESLFVRKGGSVRLDVRRDAEPPFSIFVWKFDITTFIHMYVGNVVTTFPDYKNKTEFDEKNLSLLLKNVQERDSGIYTAKITDIEGKERDVASYRLTVQEAPPTPQVGVVSLFSAGGFCNVSVNCSAKDTWASYTCDHDDCTQVANTTSPTGVNIIVTATNGTIYCSSSNRVDIKTGSKSIKDFCTPINHVASPGVTVGVIVAAAAVISITVIYKKRRKSGGSQIEGKCNTEYASVEGPGVELSNPSREVTVYETVTTAKPEHHPKVNTVYDVLGPAGDPPTQPESIYATVNKGAS
ncbi:SLAM family member 9-like [Anguilla rostrata]|uniref:SLAM family member 9-like n=1 Tax=Anguilla rostrata TaxID=7938 RepID=UPI0030D35D73